jgi:hypothetical protein
MEQRNNLGKYRGKRTDGKGWVYGYLFEDIAPQRHLSYIIKGGFVPALTMPASEFVEVDPETVGQYVGLPEEEKEQVCEGDLLQLDRDAKFIVEIRYSGGRFEGVWIGEEIKHLSPVSNRNWLQWKKIGNIHDNPELLTIVNNPPEKTAL